MRVQYLGKHETRLSSPTTSKLYRLSPMQVFEADAKDAVGFVTNGVAQFVAADTPLGVPETLAEAISQQEAVAADKSTDEANDTSYASMTRDELEAELAKVGATLEDIEGTGKEGFVRKDDIVDFLVELNSI